MNHSPPPANPALSNCKCPKCSSKLTAADCAGDPDRQPRPGDMTVCIFCGSFLVFGEGLSLGMAPDEMIIEASGTPEFKAVLEVVNEFRKKAAAS